MADFQITLPRESKALGQRRDAYTEEPGQSVTRAAEDNRTKPARETPEQTRTPGGPGHKFCLEAALPCIGTDGKC